MMVRLARNAGIRVIEVDAPALQPEGDVYPDVLDHATQCALDLHDGC